MCVRRVKIPKGSRRNQDKNLSRSPYVTHAWSMRLKTAREDAIHFCYRPCEQLVRGNAYTESPLGAA